MTTLPCVIFIKQFSFQIGLQQRPSWCCLVGLWLRDGMAYSLRKSVRIPRIYSSTLVNKTKNNKNKQVTKKLKIQTNYYFNDFINFTVLLSRNVTDFF
jgi:hypothetical protein